MIVLEKLHVPIPHLSPHTHLADEEVPQVGPAPIHLGLLRAGPHRLPDGQGLAGVKEVWDLSSVEEVADVLHLGRETPHERGEG